MEIVNSSRANDTCGATEVNVDLLERKLFDAVVIVMMPIGTDNVEQDSILLISFIHK